MRKFSRRRNKKPEFDQKLVDLARVSRVVSGGKRFRFRACMCIGDRKGKVAMGIAKGNDVSGAIAKAILQAKKKFINVTITKGTIPYRIEGEYKGAKVILMPAREGTGIIAGGAVRSVLELAGIKNISGKMLGSNNKVNNVTATINVLNGIRSPQEIAAGRGKGLREIAPYFAEKEKPVVKVETKVRVEDNRKKEPQKTQK
ncbi:MAG: 30S ribosomal protein S5 [Parcubacteria group bacterium]|nr:30S ribosomal protein S5 [Parcubacteria group bacterium]